MVVGWLVDRIFEPLYNMPAKKNTGEVTIYDIARHLKVSSSTVSRALNNYKGTNADTIKKIQEVAESMGYRRNVIASGLRKSETRTLGLILPRISMYFPSMVVSGIQDKAHASGYQLLLSQSNDDPEMEAKLVNTMYASRVDGLIVANTMHTTSYQPFDVFHSKHIPLLFFDRVPMDYPAPAIEGEDYKGGFLATEHLILKGCRRIAHFSGPLTCNIYQHRYKGYLDALKEYNLPFDESLVIFHPLTRESAKIATEQLFSMANPVDGLFSANDTSAIVAIRMARDRGIDVPQQLAVVGYSNDPTTELLVPSVTSVEQFGYQMGIQTMENMLNLLEHRDVLLLEKKHLTVPIQLVERESTNRG